MLYLITIITIYIIYINFLYLNLSLIFNHSNDSVHVHVCLFTVFVLSFSHTFLHT